MSPRAGDEVAGQTLEFVAGKFIAEAEFLRQKRERDPRFKFAREADFGRFRYFPDARDCSELQIRCAGGPDFFKEEIHEPFVQVVASESRVAVGGEHLEHTIVQFEYREIERAAAQI